MGGLGYLDDIVGVAGRGCRVDVRRLSCVWRHCVGHSHQEVGLLGRRGEVVVHACLRGLGAWRLVAVQLVYTLSAYIGFFPGFEFKKTTAKSLLNFPKVN